jgi:hypothetical protein
MMQTGRSSPSSHDCEPLSLWRVVLRFWSCAVILAALVWLDAMFGRGGTIGGQGSEPHAYLIPAVTLAGGAVALGIAWRTRIVVAHCRILYLLWTAPALVAVRMTGVGRFGFAAEPITNVVIDSGIVLLMMFLITVGVLEHRARIARSRVGESETTIQPPYFRDRERQRSGYERGEPG